MMKYLNAGSLSFIIFILVVAFILYKDRKKIVFEGGMFLRRTESGVKWIEKIYERHKKFWKWYSTASLIFAPVAMMFGIYWIIENAYKILIGATKVGAGIVLPSPSSHVVIGSGYIFLPLWLWVIGIMSIVIPHELSHGLVSLSEKINVKKVGYAFFLFIPAAFVEPDEKKLKKAKPISKIKIYGAGSFANFLFAATCLLINMLIMNAFFYNYGVSFSGLVNNSGAYNVSLNGTITHLNGMRVYDVQEFSKVMRNVTPGEYVSIVADNKTYKIKTMNDNGKTIIGISGVTTYKEARIPKTSGFLSFIMYVLSWLGILNLGVGIVNLLPIKPLDGGLIMQEYLKGKTKNYAVISNIISIIFAAILLFSIIGPRIV